ncbi:MAG: pyridoxal-phosphate dependent enzyme, partial [Gemmatimonadetes bacterium]|nr:pyridoxal-phosphate dependent enzyme [Gemmatimonadota bacterium]
AGAVAGAGAQGTGPAGRASTARIFGVEPDGAPCMRRSLDQGRAARLDATDTIADGLAPPMAGKLNYQYVAEFVEDVTLVADAEILSAMRLLLTRAKLVVEPSGAAAVAALMYGRVPVEPGRTIVALVTGGNVDDDLLVRALHEGAPWP